MEYNLSPKMSLLAVLFSLLLVRDISAHTHNITDDLSDEAHAKDGHHNTDYDHQAFLGKDQAAMFRNLSPEESLKRLGKLFPRVDENGDGHVTKDELSKWIKHSHDRYVHVNSLKTFNQNDVDKDGGVTWQEYRKITYGFLDDHKSEQATYEQMVARDEKRFKLADKEGDLKLKVDEFSAFLHPHNFEHMQGIIATETMEDIDTNKDGVITEDEYIEDVYPDKDRKGRKGMEPEWVKNERKQFHEIHDKNEDGKMDASEVNSWIIPPHYDHFTFEAEHLIAESDADKDGKISKKEMLDKHDLFVGSQATHFGEILKEEL